MFAASEIAVAKMLEVGTDQNTSALVGYKMMAVAEETADTATVVVDRPCFLFLPIEIPQDKKTCK
jgi:hypothetical protein